MQIILREDIPSLGKAGEVVKVSEGYGRNFLLPRKKAMIATEGNLKRLEQDKQVIEAKREKAKAAAEAEAQRIAALPITLTKQAGEEDKIFGSVSTRDIAAALEAHQVKIDRRLIRIKEPIRAVGEHTVELHLHHDVVVPLKVTVIKK
ncbi:MAG TPA: 50S ribosomal protein L9 [bacterium]|nr:50S ribosomal protein L9 [bacterium]